MDQVSVVESATWPDGRGGGRGSPVRRGRRNLALVTAVVLAPFASATTVAFAPPATRRSPPLIDDATGPTPTRQRQASLHALSTVSSLEAPTRTTVSPSPRVRAVHRRNKKRGAADKSGKMIEVNINSLEDAFNQEWLGHCDGVDLERSPDSDAVSGTTSRRVPAIDSEILYEGTTRAPSPLSLDGSSATVAAARIAVPSASTDDQVVVATPADSCQSTTASQQKRSSRTRTENIKSRSSTMPGFVKDANLDAQIVQHGSRRLSSPADRELRPQNARGTEAARLRRSAASAANLYARSAAVPDSLVAHVAEIHAVGRVTPREERELGTRTQEGMRLQGLRDDFQARHGGREPTDDEWCAAAGKLNAVALREAIEDGTRAKNRLVASNLRMVQRVVNLYLRNGLGSEYNAGDLMQDGTMGLIRAAEKYEPERGFRFSTYALYWIRSAVKRSHIYQGRIIYTPQWIHDIDKRITQQRSRLRKELGREPSQEELADACDISALRLERCRRAMSQATVSLDAEMENGHKPNTPQSRKDTLHDIVEGRADETERERARRSLAREELLGTLRRHLPPHEVDLLLLRYGLMDKRALPKGMSGPLTIASISSLVGLKPDRIRRIIINSQKQLKPLMKEWEDVGYELA